MSRRPGSLTRGRAGQQVRRATSSFTAQQDVDRLHEASEVLPASDGDLRRERRRPCGVRRGPAGGEGHHPARRPVALPLLGCPLLLRRRTRLLSTSMTDNVELSNSVPATPLEYRGGAIDTDTVFLVRGADGVAQGNRPRPIWRGGQERGVGSSRHTANVPDRMRSAPPRTTQQGVPPAQKRSPLRL
jgi:hypothetical protein